MPENKPLLKALQAFIFLCVLITSNNSYAQKAYEYTPGYYLTLNNDTIKADIFFNYWIISPNQVRVKDPKSGEIKDLGTDVIAGFGINTENIKVDYRSLNYKLRHITGTKGFIWYGESPFSEIEETGFFAKVLIIGKQASLFQMVDKYEKERFFLEKGGVVTELESYSYLMQKKNDTRLYMIKSEQYKVHLSSICSDAPQMSDKVPAYSENELKNYVLKYNQCFTGEVIEIKKSEKANFNFVVGIGITDRHLHRTPFSSFGPEYKSFPVNPFPLAEVGFRINFPGTFRTLFFETDYNLIPNNFTRKDVGGFLNRFNFYFGKNFRNTKKVQQRLLFGASEGAQGIILGTGLVFKKKMNLDLKSKIYRFPDENDIQMSVFRLDLTFQYVL
jgi:hypothetical protein